MDTYRGVEMRVSEKLHASTVLTPTLTLLKVAATLSIADILATGSV
jgi:hypothetical protein